MKTFYRLVLCSFLLLLHVTVVAQGKLVPAYLVTASSDTISGKLLTESQHKRTFRIKFDNGSGLQTYDAPALKAYGIGDSLHFEVHKVLVDNEMKTAFLQVAVNGPTKLYYSRDLSLAGQYYVQKPNEPVIQLQKSLYRSILNGLLTGCAQINIESEMGTGKKISYSAEGLTRVVHAYNQCVYPTNLNEVLLVEPKLKIKLGVRAGGHYNFSGSKGSSHYYKNYQLDGGPGLTAGIFINVDFRKNISFQPELLYTTRRIEMSYEYDDPSDIGYKEHAVAEASYLYSPILLQYSLGNGSLRPYFTGGVSYGYMVKSKSHSQVTYETGYSYSQTPSLKNHMIGLVLGTGIQRDISPKQRMLLEMRYSFDKINGSLAVKQVYFNTLSATAGIVF